MSQLLARASALLGPLWLASSPCLALARPGGGHTFEAPDSGWSGDGGGEGAVAVELVVFLLRLVFHYPKLMLPVLIVLAILWLKMKRGPLENWDTPHHTPAYVPVVARKAARSASQGDGLARLRAIDPDFSRVLFEDFAYRLYASVQHARPSREQLAALAPYLSDEVREQLLKSSWQSVSQVVVGALRVTGAEVPADTQQPSRAHLVYEANLTLSESGRSRTLYVYERWTLSRAQDARTKPPGSYERLGCPNCGAPFRSSDNRRCEYCNQVVADGRFNWQLESRSVQSERALPPTLTAEVAERGTDKPTVYAPDFAAGWAALQQKDPQLVDVAFNGRVALIYRELNQAWTQGELSTVRALVSDGMFDYLSYWIDAYKAQGLRNVLENMRIERIELVKVDSDRYFDAVTVRLFARGLDYTVRVPAGEHVSGSRQRERAYSEYWTLIRGSATRGAPKTEASCPNCAAPLKVSMAGTCAYCSAHVTQGEFDWVLSKIEQDDVYDG